ncbi:hypothetical protein Hanom_Chr16g01447231 [Helianthus anomalus]
MALQGRPHIYSKLYSSSSPVQHLKLANDGVLLATNFEESNYYSRSRLLSSSFQPIRSVQYFMPRYAKCFTFRLFTKKVKIPNIPSLATRYVSTVY